MLCDRDVAAWVVSRRTMRVTPTAPTEQDALDRMVASGALVRGRP
jgi:hypothetical protein